MIRPLLREMMVAAALSGLPVWGGLVVQEVRVVSPQHSDFSFDLAEIPQGQQVRLSMDARIDWKDLAGHNPYMIVNVNGTDLYGKDLINKPVEFTEHDGADVPWVRGNVWRLYYAPDFSDAVKAPTFAYGVSSVDPFRFAWDITALVHAGANTLRITSTKVLPEPTTVVARQVTVDVGPPVAAPGLAGVSPAPQGPLPTYRARGRQPVPMDVQVSPGGAIRFGVAGRVLSVVSRSSEPAGQWVTTAAGNGQPVARGAAATGAWTGTGYRVERVVRVADDHVKVRDTITNTGATRVGVIVEHRLGLPEKPDRLLLGGRPMLTRRSEPAHPTALAQWPDLLVGMVAEDDVFRVHVAMFTEPDVIGLADPRLGVAPGQAHTLEWSIYPIPKGDYWDFVNAVRRNWGSNWTIEGPVTFDHNSHVPKTAEQFREWIATRGARWISSGQTTYNQAEIAKYGGQHANNLGEGTAIPLAQEWCRNTADWIAKVRAVSPGARTLIYLDSQICTEPEAETLYSDCRVFDVNGARVATPYPYPIYLFLPTPDNTYGKALFKTLRYLCEDLGADGIYNDEFTYSAPYPFVYGLPWDGCSLDIDPGTHAIVRECSSDVLLQQPWKVEMVKYLRAKGKVLIGNGPLYTRSMLELKVPNFTEISSYSFLIETHLCTPMGLSTCDVEGTDRERVHSICRMLDHGAVIAPYVWTTQRPDFPYVQKLFPVTIEELREGVILGQERILTHRSGRFGWPDGKSGKVCVVDGDGQRVANPSVTEVREAGQWLAEIRMPSDHFAVIEKE